MDNKEKLNKLASLNPLNQVYVFNLLKKCGDKYAAMVKS